MPSRYVYDYKKANFTDIKRDLINAKLVDTVNNSKSIDEAWETWHTKVMTVINDNVPQLRLKKNMNPLGSIEKSKS